MDFDTSKWKFQTDDRVECFLGDELGWRPGYIHGIAVENIIQVFIVRLDERIGPYRSVAVPHSQIRPFKDVVFDDCSSGHPIRVINGWPTQQLCDCSIMDGPCVDSKGNPL